MIDTFYVAKFLQHSSIPIGAKIVIFDFYEEFHTTMKAADTHTSDCAKPDVELKPPAELLKMFMAHTPAAVAMCDTQMRYLAYSRPWAEDYGLGDDNLVGRCHYDLFPDLPEHWKDEHQRCFSGETIKKAEEPFPRANGTTDWVRRQLCPWRDAAGNIGGLIMFTEVITKRRRMEKALKQSEEKYRNLFETAMVGLYRSRIDDGKILAANQSFAEIMGYDSPDQFYQDFKTTEHYADPDRRQELLRLLKEKGRVDGFEIMCIRPDGALTEIAVSAILYPEHGYIEGCIIDMTEKKQAAREKERLQAKLQQAQKMEAIGTLAGGIAHDFNNLLMGIQGRTSLLLADIHADHPHFEHLSEIENYVTSAAELTRQLLGFARGGKYQVVSTDLNELVEKSSRMFGRTKKEITIEREYENDLWTADVDRSQIEQVLLNIYVNAWQAMPAGGTMFIGTANIQLDKKFVKPYNALPGDYVNVSIKDTGVGMDVDTVKKVFDPFFTTKEQERGTGLGLASAYGIVKNHDGIIIATSEKGNGATFNIYLPATGEAVAASGSISD
jgi:two-component system cell cycle sensor histidine kinase/response regulator CckA